MSAVTVSAAAWARGLAAAAIAVMHLLYVAAAAAAPVAAVTGAAVERGGDVTRIALDLSDQVAFNVFTVSDPHRIVVDLSDVSWQARSADIAGSGPCAALRHGELRPGSWRIVLECQSATTIRKALLQRSAGGSGYRLLVELAPGPRSGVLGYMSTDVRRAEPPGMAQRSLLGDSKMASAAPSLPPRDQNFSAPSSARQQPAAPGATDTGAPRPAAAPPAAAAPRAAAAAPRQSAAASPAKPAPNTGPEPAEIGATALALPPPPPHRPLSPRAERVVVLDAGHGGVDPGAIGISGIYEKDITLAAVREIKRALEETGGYKVLLTRNDDRFIRLRDRVGFARRANAELFVSIHADSVFSRDVRGASVYTLSNTASDSEAAALAEKENKADLIAGLDLSGESSEVANILIDLAQRETMNQSAAFAGHLVGRLADTTGLLPNPHRFAGFAVLKAPDIPSVLIELGFLSNRSDERALLRNDNRSRVAAAVAKAIDGYLTETMSASAL